MKRTLGFGGEGAAAAGADAHPHAGALSDLSSAGSGAIDVSPQAAAAVEPAAPVGPHAAIHNLAFDPGDGHA